MTTVAIIGGGIAGPVTALALRKAGIEAAVHEAYPQRSEGVGGTIAVAPNGQAALGLVGVDLAPISVPIHRQVMAVGGKRIALPGLPDAGPLRVVRRSDLARVLDGFGVRVEYGKRLADVRDGTAIFSDGTSVTADVLVGADGVHSRMRSLIDPAAPGPRWTRMLSFEGWSPVDCGAAPGTMTFAFGAQAYYLYWPQDGGTTWGVNLPWERPLSISEARAVPAETWIERLLAVYGGDTPGGELLRRVSPDRLQVHGALHIMPPVPRWHRENMVLAGDAVHAPSNSSGQGASLAVESALQLARCLRDLPVPQAFAAYEGLRRSRVEGVARRASRINATKAPGAIGRFLMPLLMPMIMKAAVNPEKAFGPELRYRIDWDAPVAEVAVRSS